MQSWKTLFVVLWAVSQASASAVADPWLSTGRQADPTAKTLSEIRAAERRRVPLEVQLKSLNHYVAGGPIGVTIIVTNLFDDPLLMNSRMLVNHPLLQGEISFRITGPDGKRVEFQRLITPLSLRDEDFILLNRGQSMQREVDLTDLYGIILPGDYKIQVSYHSDVDHVGGPQHVWKGIVWSEPAEFRLQ